MGVLHGVFDALVTQCFLDQEEVLRVMERHGRAPTMEGVKGYDVDSWILQGSGNPSPRYGKARRFFANLNLPFIT